MTTMGLRGVFAAVLLGSFGLLGASAPVDGLSEAPFPAAGLIMESSVPAGPGLWARARHSACVVARSATIGDTRAGDRRADCDRQLVAGR